MQLDKTKVKELFIGGNLDPRILMLFRATAGEAGLIIYLYVRWQMGFSHYLTKQKRTWIPVSNIGMEKHGFGMDPKTKNKALRKLEKENLIQLDLLDKSGKAPQVRLLTK